MAILRPMVLPPDNAGPGARPPARCDMCGEPMRRTLVIPHPEKAGHLHVYECAGCALPMVRYVPSAD